MACIGASTANSSRIRDHQLIEDGIPPEFPRARRPALIPPHASLTLAEAEDLVRSRIDQPLFPPPDPDLLKNMEVMTPPTSESSCGEAESGYESQPGIVRRRSHGGSIHASPNFSALAKDPRRQGIWLKARAHYARDRRMRKFSFGNQCPLSCTDITIQRPKPILIHPKRKQTAFIRDEELQCQLEDRVGTPHLSELVPGDEMNVEEQRLDLDMNGGNSGATEEVKAEKAKDSCALV